MRLDKRLQKNSVLMPEQIKDTLRNNSVKLNFFGEQNDKLYTGSKFGICLSIFSVSLTILYFINVIIQMRNNEFDNLMSVTMNNDFNEMDKVYVLKESSILPIVQLGFNSGLKNKLSKFDIFENSSSQISELSKKKVDYSKLSQYFRIQIRMSHKKNGTETSKIREYRLCESKDFEKLQKEQQNKVNNLNFLCIPYDDKLKQQLVLKDGYIGTLDERYAFSVEFIKSNLQNRKPDNDIQELLSYIVFTQYVIQEQADLTNYANLGKNPIIHRLKFFQQFQLNINQYRDNNNFVRFNKVETQDNEYMNTYQSEYEYYDVISQPVWYGGLAYRQKTVQYEGGDYFVEERELMSGQYFFLADERLEHSRQIATYLDIMSTLGGFSSLVFSITAFLTSTISYQFILMNIIKRVYRRNIKWNDENRQAVIEINDRRVKKFRKSIMYQKNQSFARQELNVSDYDTVLKFTTLDVITDIWLFKPLEYLFRNTRYMKNYKLFRTLKQEIQGDIEVSNIVLNNKLLFLLNDEFHDLVNNNTQNTENNHYANTNTNQNPNLTDDAKSADECKQDNRNSVLVYEDMLRQQIRNAVNPSNNYYDLQVNNSNSNRTSFVEPNNSVNHQSRITLMKSQANNVESQVETIKEEDQSLFVQNFNTQQDEQSNINDEQDNNQQQNKYENEQQQQQYDYVINNNRNRQLEQLKKVNGQLKKVNVRRLD